MLPEGFEVDPHFIGHGIGKFLHQLPQVHHRFDPKNEDCILQPGMVFTIEPIVTMCSVEGQIHMAQDKFSIVAPGVPSCQWEHIVLITAAGCEVLTKRPDESADL